MRLGINKSDFLCIDWDERSLRILDTTMQRSGPIIRRAVHVAVPAGLDVRDPSTMGDFLRRTLGEHRIRTRRAIVDVPRQDTVLNRLTLPTGSMDEMAAMVHMQIAKELPFNKDQAVIDFTIVPKPGSPTCDVWVAAIRVNVVEYYRQVFANTGLSLERMGLRPYANLRALQSLGLTQGRAVMVDIGPSMTEINILRDGELMYTRAASVPIPMNAPSIAADDGNGDDLGRQPLISADEAWPIDNLLIEVSRTIAAYRATDMGAAIDRIVLSGVAGINDRLLRAMEERFSVTAEIYSIPKSVRWKADAGQSAAPFSAVIGLALSNTGDLAQRFDFLHVKEPEGEHRQRVKRRPVVAAVVVMFAAATMVAAYQPIRSRNLEVEDLKADIAFQNRDQKSRDSALKKVTDLYDWQKGNVVWIDYLRKLAAVFPSNKDCYIKRLDIEAEKGIITVNLAAADRFVAVKVVENVKNVLDEKGRPLFDAVSGNKADYSVKEPEYPIEDEVRITVLPVAPKPKTKR